MYLLSRDKAYLKIANRVTRNADKICFKVPTKVSPVYERSPYYIGTKLWNEFSKEVQNLPNVYAFKKEIDRVNHVYVKL